MPEPVGERSRYIGTQWEAGDPLKRLAFAWQRQGFERLATVTAGQEEVDSDVYSGLFNGPNKGAPKFADSNGSQSREHVNAATQ